MDTTHHEIITTIGELHNCFLETLIEFDKFCMNNGLHYGISYGTLIGIMRSGDFLPWDDDIDVIMPRADFEKLKTIRGDISGNFELILPEDKDVFYDFIPQFVNKEYKIKRVSNQHYINEEDIITNPGMDILVLDNTVNDFRRHIQRYKALFIYAMARSHRNFDKELDYSSTNLLIKIMVKMSMILGKRLSLKRLCRMREKNATKYNKKNTGYLFPSSSMGANHIYDEKWILPTSKILLRGVLFQAPGDIDALLCYCYGDYMTPPPIEEQHNVHFDITL